MLDQRHGSRRQGTSRDGDDTTRGRSRVRDEHSGAAIRVALADDRMLLRAGLRLLLATEPSVEVISAGGDFEDVERGVRDHRPDVLVLDLATPDGAALAAISRLRNRSPQTQIVVLTGRRESARLAAVMAAGAVGFVTTDSVDGGLTSAVLAAARGARYVSPDLDGQASSGGANGRAQDELTAREVEVLRLIVLGHTSVEVARVLELSPRTVETHRARIHRKLGLATRAELVGYGLRRGLLG